MNRRLVVLPIAAVAVALAFWKWNPPPPPVTTPAACTWRTGAGTEIRQGINFDKLAPESPIRLSVHTQEPLHLYVWSQSLEDGTLLLFPSPKLQSDRKNPLPVGQSGAARQPRRQGPRVDQPRRHRRGDDVRGVREPRTAARTRRARAAGAAVEQHGVPRPLDAGHQDHRGAGSARQVRQPRFGPRRCCSRRPTSCANKPSRMGRCSRSRAGRGFG